MADWAGLHHDILFEIGKRVTSIESYDSFGAVCKSWQAASTKDEDNLKQKTFESPWLMFHKHEFADKKSVMHKFLNISTGQTRNIFLPEASNKHCLSCKDWLFLIDEDKIHASLLHLVSRVQINLPKVHPSSNYDVTSFVLSANPSSTSDFIVVVLWGYNKQLSYWKPGNTYWTAMECRNEDYFSIISYNNKLYAMEFGRRLVIFDVHGPNPTQALQQVFNLPRWNGILYMVEFSKKLFIVRRYKYYDGYCDRTRFKVYEVNIENGELMEIKNLGDKAVLRGYNSSLLIGCLEVNNCESDCVYFTKFTHSNRMTIRHLSTSDDDIVSYEDIDGCSTFWEQLLATL